MSEDTLLAPDQIDRLFGYPDGRAIQLARSGLLPHIRLPDGAVRFDREDIVKVISDGRVPPAGKGAVDAR